MHRTSKETFLLLTLASLWSLSSSSSQNSNNKNKHDVIDLIHDTVKDIYERIKAQDKLQDIKDLLKIEATLKRVEQQNDDLVRHFREDFGRTGLADDRVSGMEERLEEKLNTIETEFSHGLKGGLTKMGDLERQTGDLKQDIDKKLGKMMNVMSAMYDASEKMSKALDTKDSKGAEEEEDNSYVDEQFDQLQKKVVESFSVLKNLVTTELKEVRESIRSTYGVCEQAESHAKSLESSLKAFCQTSSHLAEEVSRKMMANMTRIQRSVNEQMEKKLKDLEARLEPGQSLQVRLVGSQSSQVRVSHSAQETEIGGKKTEAQKPDPENKCKMASEVTNPKTCWQLHQAGATCDGAYILFPQGRKAIYGYCDMTKDGGGWNVLMRRGNFGGNRESFDRNWKEYKEGFGDQKEEFWLGNENIHLLTNQEEMVLRVTLESFNQERIQFDYQPFSLASEAQNYRLHVGMVSGNNSMTYYGSSLRHHNMRPFSTFDNNNEGKSGENCASKYRGGWWFNRCHYALLTGPYLTPEEARPKFLGIQWHAWKGNNILKAVEMSIRPKNSF